MPVREDSHQCEVKAAAQLFEQPLFVCRRRWPPTNGAMQVRHEKIRQPLFQG